MLNFLQDNEALLWLLGIFSVVTFFATLALIPWIVVRLPQDYFASASRHSLVSRKLPTGMHIVVLVLKNLLGLLVITLGILMLVIPGQGLLTIVIGLILMDFPGKYYLERQLMQRQPVLRSVNWLRERGGKEPLDFGDEDT